MIARADDKPHAGILYLYQTACALVRKDTGYLTQMSSFAELAGVSTDEWSAHCERLHEEYDLNRKMIQRNLTASREPNAPIQHYLDLKEPMRPIIEGIGRYERYAASLLQGSRAWAVCLRNIFVLRLLCSIPLRVTNLAQLAYRDDNSGNLYKGSQGEWRVRFMPDDFKNLHGAAKGAIYDRKIGAWSGAALDKWLQFGRPLLRQGDDDFVIISANPVNQGQPWNNVHVPIRIVTKRFFPDCPGIGPHAFRHLLPTSFLKRHPGDYARAADLLHDQHDTVRKVYTHLNKAESSDAWEACLNDTITALSGEPKRTTDAISRSTPDNEVF